MTDNLSTDELSLLQTAARYCAAVESAGETDADDFIRTVTGILPALYLAFSGEDMSSGADSMFPTLGMEYVDEEKYETVRTRIAALMGENDVYLETFEEDMKYSDTPIAASVSESLADIFQPVCNFLLSVRAGEGSGYGEAYSACRESFEAYWSQTLVNVMRPLNNLRYNCGD